MRGFILQQCMSLLQLTISHSLEAIVIYSIVINLFPRHSFSVALGFSLVKRLNFLSCCKGLGHKGSKEVFMMACQNYHGSRKKGRGRLQLAKR